MVVWGLSNITDALQKRLCRFLIHRYLSDFLKSSINLEQLSATLYGGIASVSDVDMDVQVIVLKFWSNAVDYRKCNEQFTLEIVVKSEFLMERRYLSLLVMSKLKG